MHDHLLNSTSNTLFYNNWRTVEGLCKGTFHEHNRDHAEGAISSLLNKGLIDQRVGRDGRELYGVNGAGKEKALGLLAAAKSTEAVFLQKLGLWEGVTLKNLLKGFIEETNPGLPHPWESQEGES
ncbi:MAG: hypothetical protein R6X06_06745 [Gammaproteobacteria bacterium]